VVRLIKATNYVELSARVVMVQLAPIAFDASTFEIWGALLNGASLVLYAQPRLDMESLGRILRNERITVLWLTAPLFHELVDTDLGSLRNVRCLLTGGDVVLPGHVKRVLAAHQECRVIDGYGPTEGTTFSACGWNEVT
jgi:non-ribosomal peptide synthetase component F